MNSSPESLEQTLTELLFILAMKHPDGLNVVDKILDDVKDLLLNPESDRFEVESYIH